MPELKDLKCVPHDWRNFAATYFLPDIVYADDICLMASSPAHLQALLDALAAFCHTLHMEVSVAKTKVMVVAPVVSSPIVFTCNGQAIEQVQSFRYFGLHFHCSGSISHLISPMKAKAAGSWAVVHRHSQLQCGATVNLKLQLLQSILVPSIHYGCEFWGMHSPRVPLANKARTGLEQMYAQFLRCICAVRSNTPAAMLLTELGLSLSKVFWWKHTLEFFNKLAASPAESLFHLVLLDNQHDAFQRGVNNFCSSIAKGLASVGYEMSNDPGVASVLHVMELVHTDLQGVNDFALYCPRAAPSIGVISCTYHHWFQPCSKRRRYCQLPVSGRRMQRFLQFRLSSHSLPIVTGRFGVGSHCADRSVADEMQVVFECHALRPCRQQYAALFTCDTMRSFFGQKDHMQVFSFILDCLDFLDI